MVTTTTTTMTLGSAAGNATLINNYVAGTEKDAGNWLGLALLSAVCYYYFGCVCVCVCVCV